MLAIVVCSFTDSAFFIAETTPDGGALGDALRTKELFKVPSPVGI